MNTLKLVAATFAAACFSANAAPTTYIETFDDYSTTKHLSVRQECTTLPPWGIYWPAEFGGFFETGYCDHDSELEGNVYVDYHEPFTLLSFDTYVGVRVRSSRGGEIEWYNGETITDPLFSNVTWITICNDCEWGHHQHGALDNIRFSVERREVPEPPTWALIALPIGALLLNRWKYISHDRRKEWTKI